MGSNDSMRQTWRGIIDVPWLAQDDPNWTGFADVMGEDDDRLIDRARSAVRLRWTSGARMKQVSASIGADAPDDATIDDDRLRRIGAGYDLPRLGTMTAAQYQAYLDQAWVVHGEGGTVDAITGALNAYGIPDVEIVEEWQDWPGTWSEPDRYGWRLSIILGPNFGTLGWSPQGFPLPLDGSTVVGIAGMAVAQMRDLARLIRRWKIAASLPVFLVFRFGSAPVFGAAGITFPISFTEEAITFRITGAFLGLENEDEGIPFPIPFGPVYTLEKE